MKEFLSLLYHTSRPRFWLYLAGTYVVGFAAGGSGLHILTEARFWLLLCFFVLPANIFLYGINDYYDADTDQFNRKKRGQEHLLKAAERKKLSASLLVIALCTALLVVTSGSALLGGMLVVFLLLSYFYSAPPLRFKAHPFVDFISNILYGLPGFIGYFQSSGHLPAWPVALAVFFWTSAMHLFSAIPDIESDTKAGLTTSAIFFGQKGSLYVCSIFWTTSIILATAFLRAPWLAAVGALYLLLPLVVVYRLSWIQRVYWYFPVYNAIVGFILFWKALLG
jgi:4-hydroxybenzoate polyprenyltransferase